MSQKDEKTTGWWEAEILKLEEQNRTLTIALDKSKQDVLDLLPERDAYAWAIGEMNTALQRAKAAEIRAAGLERSVEEFKKRQTAAGWPHAHHVPVDYDRAHLNTPVADFDKKKATDEDVPSKDVPSLRAVARVDEDGTVTPVRSTPNPSGSLEDLLGYPKEGR